MNLNKDAYYLESIIDFLDVQKSRRGQYHSEETINSIFVKFGIPDIIFSYPAIFTTESDGVSVHFPDLPGCLTCGDDFNEALKNAAECLGLHLYGMMKDHDILPGSNFDLDTFELDPNEKVQKISVNMSLVWNEVEKATD